MPPRAGPRRRPRPGVSRRLRQPPARGHLRRDVFRRNDRRRLRGRGHPGRLRDRTDRDSPHLPRIPGRELGARPGGKGQGFPSRTATGPREVRRHARRERHHQRRPDDLRIGFGWAGRDKGHRQHRGDGIRQRLHRSHRRQHRRRGDAAHPACPSTGTSLSTTRCGPTSPATSGSPSTTLCDASARSPRRYGSPAPGAKPSWAGTFALFLEDHHEKS